MTNIYIGYYCLNVSKKINIKLFCKGINPSYDRF